MKKIAALMFVLDITSDSGDTKEVSK